MGIPGSSKKTALDQKVSACTGSPRTPCINVANHHFSMGGASLAVLFEGSAKRCFHTTLKLGDQGCLTVLARVHSSWMVVFFEEPSMIHMIVAIVVSEVGRKCKNFWIRNFASPPMLQRSKMIRCYTLQLRCLEEEINKTLH